MRGSSSPRLRTSLGTSDARPITGHSLAVSCVVLSSTSPSFWNCRVYRAGTDTTAPNSSRIDVANARGDLTPFGGLGMIDSWTKKTANGKTVTFKLEGDRNSGFVYSAAVDARDTKEITGSLKVPAPASGETVCVYYLPG